MFAGVPLLPTSMIVTSKENAQPTPFAKVYGGARLNCTSNGSAAFGTGSVGQVEDRLPAYCTGGGAPGAAPGSGVQTPPATLTQDGKKWTRLNVWSSGAPASWLGPLVIVRLILTV